MASPFLRASGSGVKTKSPLDSYQVLGQVGSGSFGKAFLVRGIEDDKKYVLKKIRLSRQSERQREVRGNAAARPTGRAL